MNPIDDLSFLIDEPFEVYLEKASEYLSSHQLRDFRDDPLLYHKRKTGELPGEPDRTWFESDAKRYGYIHQMAFYRVVLGQAVGNLAEVPVQIIAVEKQEPYRCGVWRLAPDVLTHAQRENEQALERLKRCEETDTWPTGYEEVRTFDYL